jgi:hypothetical protein
MTAFQRCRQHLLRLLVVVFLSTLIQSPSKAAFKPDLIDSYLEREYDWAMFIDTHELKSYLDYPGTQLRPLTKARVNFRWFPRGVNFAKTSAKVYEEFWYHRGIPVGSRRHNQLNIPSNKIGAIVLGRFRDKDNSNDQSAAASNALIRILIDLQLKETVAGVVMVPADIYDDIAGGLSRYRFSAKMEPGQGRQMSIHLRSYPAGRDGYYFFNKN